MADDIDGLLTPGLKDNMQLQMLMSAAAGLLNASASSPTPKTLAGVAGGGMSGAVEGMQSGLNQALKIRELNKPQILDAGTDPLTGEKSYTAINPFHPEIANAVKVAQGGVSSALGGAGGGAAGGRSMADTIAKINALGTDATPEQRLAAVPKEYQQYVAALNRGDAIPANLGRGTARQGLIDLTHMVYPDFNEQTIAQRTQYAHGMAMDTPSSPGGQKLNLNTAIQHAAELSDQYVKLHNPGAPTGTGWIPGSGPAMNAYNAVANSSADRQGLVNAIDQTSQKLSGETGKLYSGNTGGGEAERQQTQSYFKGSNNPNQTTEGFGATGRLLVGRLNALQTQRDQVYGSSGRGVHPLIDPETAKSIDRLNTNLVKLGGQPIDFSSASGEVKGGKGSPASAGGGGSAMPPPPPAIAGSPGLQWNPDKRMFRDASGKVYDANGNPVGR
jgi:hypothetical protein